MGNGILRRIFAFNGDADGLCALQQLKLAERPEAALLVTGPKRRTRLLEGLDAGPGDELTVLDISLHTNREDVSRLLDAGSRIRYFDHHHAGELPRHERLQAFIDPSPDMCTSAIVDRFLGGAHAAWAAVGAFGDNLAVKGRSLARAANLSAQDEACVERLGMLLNYNSYGEAEEDLHFAPAALHGRLAPYADPVAFVREDSAYATLDAGYEEDMARIAALRPLAAEGHGAVYVLPDEDWARRVSGVLANQLAREAPGRAHAVVTQTSRGSAQVSVRAPLERPTGASALCLEYASGGGRASAAGINDLPLADLPRFTRHFLEHFRP